MGRHHQQQATQPVNMLAILTLPEPATLSDAQLRGAGCVWCGTVLTAETARDLGERPAPDGGTMFPRGCASCVRSAAIRCYNTHSRSCEQCVGDPTTCDTRRGLRRLALEGR
jgi:hypothetical protein